MDIKNILNIDNLIKIASFIGFIISFVINIINLIKAIKAKKWDELKSLLTDKIKPLMEQAETMLTNGEEREQWVIKKISDITCIDFYKYPQILELTKNIISSICEETKLEINKIVIEKTENDTTQKNGGLTNGIS